MNKRVSALGAALALGLMSQTYTALASDLNSVPLPELPNAVTMLPEANSPMRLELSLSKRRVSLISDDTVIKSYPVAVGKPGWETPVGSHQVQTKYIDPPWRHWDGGQVVPGGDPYNPLGTRWIGFWKGTARSGSTGVAGFHGTTQKARASIGSAASHGCVRMYKEHIEELFELVEVGMTVDVVR
ncbi:MAG: L,D-transpeptidase [Cyanobacteria bacterium P01_F01_bin.42]